MKMIEDFVAQLNNRKISRQKKQAILRNLEKRGFSGQIIAFKKNDTREVLAVVDYFEWRRRLRFGGFADFSLPRNSQACRAILRQKETPLAQKKAALAFLGERPSPATLAFLEKQQKRLPAELQVWRQVLVDELLVSVKKSKSGKIVLTYIPARAGGVRNFNDQLMKIAPYYFCDRFCPTCARQRSCTFWLENSQTERGAKIDQRLLIGFFPFMAELIFLAGKKSPVSQKMKRLEKQAGQTFRQIMDFIDGLVAQTKHNFWLEAALGEDIKNLLLFTSVFWEKIKLATLVFQPARRSQKDFDAAGRFAALALHAILSLDMPLEKIAREAPQACFGQYLKLSLAIKNTKKEIFLTFPQADKQNDKVIINFSY